MTQHEEHRTCVAKRWAEKRKASKESSNYNERQFEEYARKTLLSYGWSENDVEKMMKIIMKGGDAV